MFFFHLAARVFFYDRLLRISFFLICKMKTEIISSFNNLNLLENAADAVRKGKVVAFPTETVYGLGCSIHSEEGMKEIFSALTDSFQLLFGDGEDAGRMFSFMGINHELH